MTPIAALILAGRAIFSLARTVWNRDCFLRGHELSVKTLKDYVFRNTRVSLRRLQVEFLAKCNKLERVALVVVLFIAMNPSAILLAVVSIIINPIKLMLSAWALSKIGNEALKAAFPIFAKNPPVANGDAATSVVLVASAVGIHASSLHVGPNVLRRAIRQSVLRFLEALDSNSRSAAAFNALLRSTCFQVKRKNSGATSAFARTQKMASIFSVDSPFTVFGLSNVVHGVNHT